MVISPLATTTIISPNKNPRGNTKIDTITIHVMAVNQTVKQCGDYFSHSSSQASSNYGIDSKGNIACYVPEEYRSWATSNRPNDFRAITIEVANDGGKQTGYHVTDTAIKSLIELITDVCKRNGIKQLKFSSNKSDRVNHKNGCNMTLHRDYAAKACPGDYLVSKHPYIAEQVNKKLSGGTSPVNPSVGGYVYNGVDMSPVFDPVFYANKYADLKQAFGYNSSLLFSHFVSNGMGEARQAKADFNPVVYRQKYPDLDKAFGDNWPMYYVHYCTNGKAEGRVGI